MLSAIFFLLLDLWQPTMHLINMSSFRGILSYGYSDMFFIFGGEGSRHLFHAPHNRPPWRRMWGRRPRGAYSTNTGYPRPSGTPCPTV